MDDGYAPHRSLISVIAIIAAAASFLVHSGAAGLALAVVAIVLGAIGFLLSLSSATKGGCLSVGAVVLGIVGGIGGIIRALWHFGRHL
ncbi:MAG: hypothetical protein JWN51_696 [Phycisphaerales bacterium]|nr:hypothetical protein [Phycisphaerales bacterium]